MVGPAGVRGIEGRRLFERRERRGRERVHVVREAEAPAGLRAVALLLGGADEIPEQAPDAGIEIAGLDLRYGTDAVPGSARPDRPQEEENRETAERHRRTVTRRVRDTPSATSRTR